MSAYINNWDSLESMCSSFNIEPSELDGATVLYASYTYEDYSGSALVLYRRAGVLYEVNGSHCSCYGLEGQWDPEPTSLEALEKRTYPDLSDAIAVLKRDGEHA